MPSSRNSESSNNPRNTTNMNGFKGLQYCKQTNSSSEVAYVDVPPDSFWVPKEDEKDWFDQNAIINRTSSRKLSFSTCPTHQENLLTPHRSSSSYNYTSPFIGLQVGYHRPSKVVERRTTVYFPRSRSEPGSKLALQVTEPASPQVNCLGKVGRKKEKVDKKTGVWQSIATVFRTGFKSEVSNNNHCNSVVNKERTEPVGELGLAGLMRLRSGRRSSGIIEPKRE